MLISLNWLRDFLDFPAGLDPRELALQFTLTTAEVEGVEHREPNFDGLVAVRIESIRPQPGEARLRAVVVDAGQRKYTSLTSAPDLKPGDLVVYAPPGSTVGGHEIAATALAGSGAGSAGRDARPTADSEGMIVAWGSLGFTDIGAHAIFLPPGTPHGQAVDRGWFDDWVIEIDNKSITHRPDCWGHYGVARELAALLRVPLKRYDVTPVGSLRCGLPAIPVEIDDPQKCPRYSALLMRGLKAQPAPLWMQARLAMCGQRPIDLLVDLTNYIMLELGQPMHAFDAARLRNIQVATAAPGERFTTLDGVIRTMPPDTLMIQCDRRSVAIAGIMGGAETEVSRQTDTVLLESANFDAATIRRAATAMGHRTEASARFEKSLDPAHTVLGIARFHRLAKAELPGLELASTLSDCYPHPQKIEPIDLDCAFAARLIGRDVSAAQIVDILSRLEFTCEEVPPAPSGGAGVRGRPPSPAAGRLRVTPPSFRATKDIEIETDLIEEVARFIGYNNIEPALPVLTARHFAPQADLALEARTLDQLCLGGPFVEVHSYIWYEDAWLRTLGFDPGECLTLRNPAAEGSARLRRDLAPGLLAFADRNRHHHDAFCLLEIGSVFLPGFAEVENSQQRHLGLLAAVAGRKMDSAVWDTVRSALDDWGVQVLNEAPQCRSTRPARPWEDTDRIAEVFAAGRPIGRISIVPLACRQRMDERLGAWSIALAEIHLGAVIDLIDRHDRLAGVPRYPQVRLDFSTLLDAGRHYETIAGEIAAFRHPALRRLSFLEAYQGGSLPAGRRSLNFRAEIGLEDRTLTDAEIQDFRRAFTDHLRSLQIELRA